MFDVVVIGCGPSGMGCALNLLRANRSVLVLEKEAVGGQIATSPRVENIPGIKEISGLAYSDALFEQIIGLGAEFDLEQVNGIEKIDEGQFIVKTESGREIECHAVVIANGVTHRSMGLKNEQEFVGKGVSYCAVCDGAFYKGQEVYLIGDGNTACQYALLLSNYCSKVHMFALFDHLFGDNILIDRIKNNDKVIINYNMSCVAFNGETELTGLVFEDKITHAMHEYKTNNVFVAIGQIPNNKCYQNVVELDTKGYILTDSNMQTKTPGVYAVGDTRKKDLRQVVTALSDGSIAAINVSKYIDLL